MLLFTSVCLMVGGAIIVVVGMTIVFVPEDLAFIGLTKDDLHTINPRLVPLIAHDRSGFGGGVCCCGLTMLGCIWFGGRSRSLWQALCVVGIAGFGTAMGVHPAIGYTNFIHLAPAYLGAVLFATGLALAYSPPCPQCE